MDASGQLTGTPLAIAADEVTAFARCGSQRLINLYDAWDQPNEAAKWRAEMMELNRELQQRELLPVRVTVHLKKNGRTTMRQESRHRVITTFAAESEGINSREVVRRLVDELQEENK